MTAALARVGGRIRLHTPQAPSPPSVGQPCRQWGALWWGSPSRGLRPQHPGAGRQGV